MGYGCLQKQRGYVERDRQAYVAGSGIYDALDIVVYLHEADEMYGTHRAQSFDCHIFVKRIECMFSYEHRGFDCII